MCKPGQVGGLVERAQVGGRRWASVRLNLVCVAKASEHSREYISWHGSYFLDLSWGVGTKMSVTLSLCNVCAKSPARLNISQG